MILLKRTMIRFVTQHKTIIRQFTFMWFYENSTSFFYPSKTHIILVSWLDRQRDKWLWLGKDTKNIKAKEANRQKRHIGNDAMILWLLWLLSRTSTNTSCVLLHGRVETKCWKVEQIQEFRKEWAGKYYYVNVKAIVLNSKRITKT